MPLNFTIKNDENGKFYVYFITISKNEMDKDKENGRGGRTMFWKLRNSWTSHRKLTCRPRKVGPMQMARKLRSRSR